MPNPSPMCTKSPLICLRGTGPQMHQESKSTTSAWDQNDSLACDVAGPLGNSSCFSPSFAQKTSTSSCTPPEQAEKMAVTEPHHSSHKNAHQHWCRAIPCALVEMAAMKVAMHPSSHMQWCFLWRDPDWFALSSSHSPHHTPGSWGCLCAVNPSPLPRLIHGSLSSSSSAQPVPTGMHLRLGFTVTLTAGFS